MSDEAEHREWAAEWLRKRKSKLEQSVCVSRAAGLNYMAGMLESHIVAIEVVAYDIVRGKEP